MAGLHGLRALVTGGVSGIGLATVRTLQEQGATVGVIDHEQHAKLPGDVAYRRADVAFRNEVADAVTDLVDELGGLDILVNNVGVGAQGTIEANDDAEWHHVFDINVLGLVRVTGAALPALRGSSQASIVNVCSIAATAGLPNRALYSATKGAVLSLTLAMAADAIVDGIRVNAVNPGTVDTPWIGRLLDAAADPAAERAALSARQPHGRLVSADEVAAAIAFLASPASASTTGTWLAVDGGMSGLRRPPRS
jgi:2-keto-3-deoxy-L-fuconate dehydrogenase